MDLRTSRISLFAENALDIKQEFAWQNALTRRLAAMLYALEDKPLDGDAIRDCHRLIKRRTGGFSMFRGNMAIALAALLSLSRDPEALLEDALDVYERLKDERFRASDYLVIAAYLIASNAPGDRSGSAIARAREFYAGMKSEHWMLTGTDDYIFSAMLGLSDIEISTGLADMESLYRELRREFSPGNAVQGLAQVLVLGGATREVVGRLRRLSDALRADGNRMDRGYTLCSLGVLALLPMDIGVLTRQIDEAIDALRDKKGFGALSVSKQEILLYASSIVASVGMEDARNGILPSISTSLTNIIIAQQAAMTAAIAASTAAAASSSSN